MWSLLYYNTTVCLKLFHFFSGFRGLPPMHSKQILHVSVSMNEKNDFLEIRVWDLSNIVQSTEL